MRISPLGGKALCPCFSLAHRFYCGILEAIGTGSLYIITFFHNQLGFGEKSVFLPTGRQCLTDVFDRNLHFLLVEVLAIDFCQSTTYIKNILLIRKSSTGELPSDLISLGSCKMRDPENIFCENNAAGVSFRIGATKQFN